MHAQTLHFREFQTNGDIFECLQLKGFQACLRVPGACLASDSQDSISSGTPVSEKGKLSSLFGYAYIRIGAILDADFASIAASACLTYCSIPYRYRILHQVRLLMMQGDFKTSRG